MPLLALSMIGEGCRILVKGASAADPVDYRFGGSLDGHDVAKGEAPLADALSQYLAAFVNREQQSQAAAAVSDPYQASRLPGRSALPPVPPVASAAATTTDGRFVSAPLNGTTSFLSVTDLTQFRGLSPIQRASANAVDLLLSGRACIQRRKASSSAESDWAVVDASTDVRLEWESMKFVILSFVPKIMEVH